MVENLQTRYLEHVLDDQTMKITTKEKSNRLRGLGNNGLVRPDG